MTAKLRWVAAVERTGAAIIGAGAPQFDMFPDDADHIRRLADLLDDFVGIIGWNVGMLEGWKVTPHLKQI